MRLQCRHDERQIKTPPPSHGPSSRSRPPAMRCRCWTGRWSCGRSSSTLAMPPSMARTVSWRFCATPTAALRTCTSGTGWEAEFPRDVWELRRLGVEGNRRLRFDGIPQPWLRQLAKRFARWRLSIGRSHNQTYIDVRAITRLAGFLTASTVQVTSLAGITRPVLERYLADLATDPRSLHSRSRDIGSLSAFLDAIRRHEWDREPADERGVLSRRLPQTREAPASRAGRAHHGPGRAPGEPRPVEQPREPAAHRHPHALRVAHRRRQHGSDSTASSATATPRPTCATPTAR